MVCVCAAVRQHFPTARLRDEVLPAHSCCYVYGNTSQLCTTETPTQAWPQPPCPAESVVWHWRSCCWRCCWPMSAQGGGRAPCPPRLAAAAPLPAGGLMGGWTACLPMQRRQRDHPWAVLGTQALHRSRVPPVLFTGGCERYCSAGLAAAAAGETGGTHQLGGASRADYLRVPL